MLLDFDPTVIAIGSQPFWLRWSEGSGRPVARRHRDRAPCHADVVQPVGVAVIDSPRTPGDYRPLLYRPAWRRQAARLRPEVMTLPDCLRYAVWPCNAHALTIRTCKD
jgi:hypothetical protein